MIIIPMGVLLWAIVVVAGGPSQFLGMLNSELRQVAQAIVGWVSIWL